MASETIFVSGTVRWCKPSKQDKFGKYTTEFFPDKKSQQTIKKAKLNLEVKEDEKGAKFYMPGQYYRVKRDHKKMIKDQEVEFGPVKVVKATGEVDEKGVPKTEDYNGLIGHGSEATLKIVVYDAGPHKGHRWEGIRIDKLVEYDPESQKELSVEYPF